MKRYLFYLIFLFSNYVTTTDEIIYANLVLPWLQHDQPDNHQILDTHFFNTTSFQEQQNQLHQNIRSSAEYATELERLDFECRKKYQMGLLSYNNLMNKNVSDFLKTVLQDYHSYDLIVKLAAQYNKKHKKTIKKVDEDVDKELQRRNKIQKNYLQKQQDLKEKEIEEHKKNQKKLQQDQEQRAQVQIVTRFKKQQEKFIEEVQRFGLDPAQSIFLPTDFDLLNQNYEFFKASQSCYDSEISKIRYQAAQKSLDQKLVQSEQIINLSVKSQAYLKHKGLVPELYQNFYGTDLQKELHYEICQTFEQITRVADNSHYASLFLDIALKSNDAAFWANKFEETMIAVSFEDMAQAGIFLADWIALTAIKYAPAVIESAVESGKDLAHMVIHPVDTIKNLALASGFILETLALYSSDYDEEFFKPLRKERGIILESIMDEGKQAFLNASGPDRVKMISRLGFDCILVNKATQVAGAFVGVVRSQGSKMRTFEWAADLIEQEAEFAGPAQKLFEIQEELEKSVIKSVGETSGIKSSSKVVTADLVEMIKIRSVVEILEDVARYGGKIPLSDVALCNEVRQLIKKTLSEISCAIDPKLKKIFAQKKTIKNSKSFDHNLMIEHIINPDVKVKINKVKGILEIEIGGGHLAGTTEALETWGLIKILEKKKLTNGCYEYKIEDFFNKKPITKTEFPPSWDCEKILKSSWEVYENQKSFEYEIEYGKWARTLFVDNKLDVSIVIKKFDECNNIVTAYPYKIQKKLL